MLPMDRVFQIVKDEGRRQGVEEELILALINAESGFDPDVVSPKGAVGLMQVMPLTAGEQGLRPGEDLFSPEVNIYHGTKYIKKMLDRYSGSIGYAVSAYNNGPGAVVKGRPVPSPQFVARVYAFYEFLKLTRALRNITPLVFLGSAIGYVVNWIGRRND